MSTEKSRLENKRWREQIAKNMGSKFCVRCQKNRPIADWTYKHMCNVCVSARKHVNPVRA